MTEIDNYLLAPHGEPNGTEDFLHTELLGENSMLSTTNVRQASASV